VSQEDGVPVPEAVVRMEHVGTGMVRTALTDSDGEYALLLLPPGGPYTLTVHHLAYTEERREGIRLQVGETRTLDFVLTEQAIELEGLLVEAERAEVFNPEQVGPAIVIPERQIEAAPLLSRDLMDLTTLSPLVRTTEEGGFSVAGQNERYNTLLIDGVPNKDLFGLTAGGVPGAQAGARLLPLDAVAQYEVLVAPFDVRLSGFTGGVMNAVTKTGTNDFRGRAFAVNRNEIMTGDLTLPTGSVEPSGVERTVLGLSLGGPIVPDRAHFFVSGEFEGRSQPPNGYNLTREPPSLVRIAPETAGALADFLSTEFGIPTGKMGPYGLDRSLTSVFARVDWTLSERHRMTVRNVFSRAENDESPNRSAFNPYGFSSNGVARSSATNTTSFQLFSDLEDVGANELTLSVQRSWDRTRPVADGPQIEVDVVSSIDDVSYQRGVRFGGEYFAHENDLDQTSVRVTDAFTFESIGGSTTLGVTGVLYDIAHRYVPAADGYWFFASTDDVYANRPFRYERGVMEGDPGSGVDLSAAEWGFFAQHQIATEKGLTMRFGIRFDMPHVLDHPDPNPTVLNWFGYETEDVPSGMLMISPRWGFNWQSEGARRWQVRGGAGLFTGQIPYVWLSDAFRNNGLGLNTRICTGRIDVSPPEGNTVPPFVPGTHPQACVYSFGENSFQDARTVTVFRNGFKYPQELKFSLAADRELTSSLSASASLLFSHAINQVVLQEKNLDDPSSGSGALDGFGGSDRRLYGGPGPVGNPDRLLSGHEQVLAAENETQDWSFALSGELKGQLTERLWFQGGYSYSRSFDHMSLVAGDMVSNFGFNAVDWDANQPSLRPSNFDRPHKIVASVWGTPVPGLERTEISLLYVGQSGLPFSYVYGGDLNGDGYPGVGPAFDRWNDLIYVPNRVEELPASPITLALLSEALESDPCLSRYRGRILERNACRSPWQNRLDLRLGQGFSAWKTDLRLEVDVINVLNLIHGKWGTIKTVRPVVPLLDLKTIQGQPFAQWGGSVLPTRSTEGRLRPLDPWTVVTPDSQWQMQVSLRASFGGEG
jgi:hypothetical protein